LTELELFILSAIVRVGDGLAYGVLIGREIEHVGGRRTTRAALYVALDRLEQRGMVRSTLGDPTPERGGRAKRYFTITAKGLRAVKEAQRGLVALWAGTPKLAAGLS
jgi:DNA-binding PadR family transcriptional regulator